MTKQYGPKLKISQEIHQTKYRMEGESFEEACYRFANKLTENEEEFRALSDILLNQRFMGGGRTQAAIGAPRQVTPFNCFVSGIIDDSMDSIMHRAKDAAETMRLGGGIGYDFSRLRPRGDIIASLDSKSSGPVSFMNIFDAICHTIAGAGHRRGAQMGVLRVDHPDIEEFIRVKQTHGKLSAFNISIGITNEFMQCVRNDQPFPLVYDGRTYKMINAVNLWEEIMRSTWDWADPGVLFLDNINATNNLWYCETIEATNPCGEQPLPPHGACLLGSFNLVKYIGETQYGKAFDMGQFKRDIHHVVRAMDNIHDISIFPLPQQEEESQQKRRMGLGLTGVANAGEALGHPYGTPEFLGWFECLLSVYRDEIYRASVELAKEKGPFPMFDAEKYMQGAFIQRLPEDIRDGIREHGIRNSHLLSIAPTGTISLSADNVSSGIEPVFSHFYDRDIETFNGKITERVTDYAYREWGIVGRKADEVSPIEHLEVLALATKYVDSACSKTINCNGDTPWMEFKDIYMYAWKLGCKGVTTFNKDGKRYGVLNDVVEEDDEAKACYIDPTTGVKECS